MTIGRGLVDRYLGAQEMRDFVSEALATSPVDGKRVLILIPDGTRTMTMPRNFFVGG